MTTSIKVVDTAGGARTEAEGEAVRAAIEAGLERGCTVTVSFRGIQQASETFVKAALGPIAERMGIASLKGRLLIIDQTWQVERTIRKTVHGKKAMTTSFKVEDTAGNARTEAEGEAVRAAIEYDLERGCTVRVSFRGIQQTSETFVKAAFGPIVARIGIASLKGRLLIIDQTWRVDRTIRKSVHGMYQLLEA